jgi:hypothetical protein
MLQARRLLAEYQPNWLASAIRSFADRLDPPVMNDEVRRAVDQTRRELLVAQGLEEEARHTVALLTERLQRLEGIALR